MQSTPPPTWLPVTEANKLLAACNDRAAALRDLDDLIARGEIRLRATGITSLHRNEAGSNRQPSGPVQAATWAAIRKTDHEPAMWATGVVTLPATPTHTGLVLSGVRLACKPFLRLVEEYAVAGAPAPPPVPADASQSGRRAPGGQVRWRDWDQVWIEIVNLALDDRLNRAEFPSITKLREAIEEKVPLGLFSERKLKEFLSPVYKMFVQ